MTSFKVGDVVILKSGGRPMTVTDDDGKQLTCQWHDDRGQPRSWGYAYAAVKKSPLRRD